MSIDKSVTVGNTNENGAGHDIEVRESSSGNIVAATTSNATTSANAEFGVSVENGTVNDAGVKGAANALGLTGGGATFARWTATRGPHRC